MAYLDFLKAIANGEGVVVMADGRVFVKEHFEFLIDPDKVDWESDYGEADDSGPKED